MWSFGQNLAADSIVRLLELHKDRQSGPISKIIKNLCAFSCCDPLTTPCVQVRVLLSWPAHCPLFMADQSVPRHCPFCATVTGILSRCGMSPGGVAVGQSAGHSEHSGRHSRLAALSR